MKKHLKCILVLLVSASLSLSLFGCSTPPANESIKTSGVYFDTVISIEIWGTNDEKILEHCKEMCSRFENLLSITIKTSDISRINDAKGAPVKVADDTAQLIKEGLHYSQISDGAFDITIAPLSELWDIGHNPGNIPDQAAIDEAKSHVNYKNVIVKGDTVTLKDPKAAIDLGGIAKGYIADQLKAYLKSKGIKHGLIDLGGNVVVIGKKMDGQDFRIGIQKPFDKRNEAITSVEVDGKSVVSSGIYERYFKKNGKIYHHILNPKTGYPYDNGLLQVTIISDRSVDGDGLSTTCFALGLEKGSELVKSLDGVEAIFVTNDYKLHYAE